MVSKLSFINSLREKQVNNTKPINNSSREGRESRENKVISKD